MTMNEYYDFAFFLVFFAFWFIVNYKGMVAPERLLRSWWGRSAYRDTPPKKVRWISIFLLAAGLGLVGSTLWELSNRTFKWRGNPKTYSFSDFYKPTGR
jgi:hypothetical protein